MFVPYFEVALKYRADAVDCVPPFASSLQQAGRPLIHRLALACVGYKWSRRDSGYKGMSR
jgi:hypothetical protein